MADLEPGTAIARTAEGARLREAVAFFVIAMIRADGVVEETELDAARATMARCILFAENSVEEDRALLRLAETALLADPVASAAHHAPALSGSPWRYTALAIMTDIMMADGAMDAHELRLLTEVAGQFGIDRQEVEVMVDNVNTDGLEDLITGANPDAMAGLWSMRGHDRPAEE